MVKEDTILLESDLIFDHDLLSSLVQSQAEDMAVVIFMIQTGWMEQWCFYKIMKKFHHLFQNPKLSLRKSLIITKQ